MSALIAYSGPSHTREAAYTALADALDAVEAGLFSELRAARAPASDNWPSGVMDVPILGDLKRDDPRDIDWSGLNGIHTRLALVTEAVDPEPYVGGPGAELSVPLALDWFVLATGAVEPWRRPVFEHALRRIGEALTALRLTPSDHWTDLSVGRAELMTMDIGEHSISTASIPIELTLDSDSLLG